MFALLIAFACCTSESADVTITRGGYCDPGCLKGCDEQPAVTHPTDQCFGDGFAGDDFLVLHCTDCGVQYHYYHPEDSTCSKSIALQEFHRFFECVASYHPLPDGGGFTVYLKTEHNCTASPPVPAPPPMPTGCIVKGPSYSIASPTQSGGPYKGVKDVAACASLCKESSNCTAFHYYGVCDDAYGDCYLHSGGTIDGPMHDGRDRYAGTCSSWLHKSDVNLI